MGSATEGAGPGQPNPNQANQAKKPPGKNRCIGHYMIGKNIGEGTFGKVKAGTHNVTGEKVSVQKSKNLLEICIEIKGELVNRSINQLGVYVGVNECC